MVLSTYYLTFRILNRQEPYYKLANDASTGLGWYWGAANGDVFTNGAHKAHLALPQTFAGSRSFISLFGEDESTGIATMNPSPLTVHHVYNLSGQRVATMQKGRVYIVRSTEGRLQGKNGKKLLAR